MPALSQAAAPVAVDDTAAIIQNMPGDIDVLANDTDADGDILRVIDYTKPLHGSVAINPDGTLAYTPALNYTGPDSFVYTIIDGTGGLTHFWGLPGDALDSVGTAHGTLYNNPAVVAGHDGQALDFNKTNEYVRIPDFDYNASFTIAFWFKFDENAGTGWQYMYSHGANATQDSVNIMLGESGCTTVGDRNQLITVFQDNNDFFTPNDLYVDISGLINDGLWHLYELTVSGAGSSVYIDGALRDTSTHGGQSFNPTTDLFLGAREDLAAGRWSGGMLDSVRVYDRALSAGEASMLYTTGHLADTASATCTIDVEPLQCPGWIVTTTLDSGIGSLRKCIIEANKTKIINTIIVPAGIYLLTTPGQNEDKAATGDLDITKVVNISGAGADVTIVDGGGLDRVFHVLGKNFVATITGLTISNGNSGSNPGGGVLLANVTLNLTDVSVTGNSTTDNGGGIYNKSGRLTLDRATVSGNTAKNGGGIGGESVPAATSMTNVTLSNNTAVTNGGGIWDKGGFDISMTNVTIADNSAAASGGILRNNGTMTVKNTIIANNLPGNCSKLLTSNGNNLDTANTCGFNAVSDLKNTNPQLGPFQNNGGTLLTQALFPCSPAIDTGTNTGCPAVDERGVARPIDGNGDSSAVCDMGAYEAPTMTLSLVKQAWEVNGTAPLASPSSVAVGSTFVFLIYVKNTFACSVTNVRINDLLDEAGFQYVTGSLLRTSVATPPADTATDLQIFNATAGGIGTALTDVVDGDAASAIDTGGLAGPDRITIGAVTGQANGSLSIAAHTTFALRFSVKVK